MRYQDELLKHLVAYKTATLGELEDGLFEYRGRDVRHSHILPKELAWLNIVAPMGEVVQEYVAANLRGRVHKYFHHLNSSQAFAFNLFIPFFSATADTSAALLRALGQSASLSSWALETVPHEGEQTNIDASWQTTDGVTIYCEVKLSEAEFGKAVDDPRHNLKLRETYAPTLGVAVDSELLEPTPFFEHYQLLRNVWHIVNRPGAHLVFLLPRANVRLWAELTSFLLHLKEPFRTRVSMIATESVLRQLSTDALLADTFREYAVALCRKYIVP